MEYGPVIKKQASVLNTEPYEEEDMIKGQDSAQKSDKDKNILTLDLTPSIRIDHLQEAFDMKSNYEPPQSFIEYKERMYQIANNQLPRFNTQ